MSAERRINFNVIVQFTEKLSPWNLSQTIVRAPSVTFSLCVTIRDYDKYQRYTRSKRLANPRDSLRRFGDLSQKSEKLSTMVIRKPLRPSMSHFQLCAYVASGAVATPCVAFIDPAATRRRRSSKGMKHGRLNDARFYFAKKLSFSPIAF